MSEIVIIFLIIVFGYLIGSIKILGMQLGSSAILLVALVFGHFGLGVSSIIREIGLVCFVTTIGFIAGPVFFRTLKNKASSYILIGTVVIFTGAITCIGVIKLFDIPTALSVGMFTGALTSTPGLAAAIEATGDTMASVGYGIAYPFGVVGVVLFIQLVPKFLKVDLKKESTKMKNAVSYNKRESIEGNYFIFDDFGFFPLGIAILLGLLLAKLTIPLPGGASFALGTSGAPLLIGLIMGHYKHVGPISISVPKSTLDTMREFGLILFLMGAGTNAGKGFVEILQQYGVSLFLIGAVMTLLPMICGYIVSTKILKLDLLNSLGSICGGMTSTPALGTLISVSGTDDVAASYAATYPIALIFVVLFSQFISILF